MGYDFVFDHQKFPAKDFVPGNDSDALQLCGLRTYLVRNCIIDASELEDGSVDEACGITHGASALFQKCLFKGAAKLVLVGSGDKEFAQVEKGKTVTFENCLFDSFGRRGPEVQSGMQVYMKGCVVSNWGDPKHFVKRVFGAWVHNGGFLDIEDSVFYQGNRPSFKHWLLDHAHHIGQAVNDHGLSVLLEHLTYVSGYKRACTWDPDDDSCSIQMSHCWASSDCEIRNELPNDPMSDEEAAAKITSLRAYFDDLKVVQAQTDWRPR